MRDRILVEGLHFDGRHGLLPAERETGVRFRVDLELEANLAPSAASDRLVDTVDYREVAACIERLMVGESYSLVERLGAEICGEILKSFPAIDGVRLQLRKLVPETKGHPEAVGVKITRRR